MIAKSPGLVPDREIDVMEVVCVPAFSMVMVCEPVLVPVATEPNAKLVVESVMACPANPVPLSATVSGEPTPAASSDNWWPG